MITSPTTDAELDLVTAFNDIDIAKALLSKAVAAREAALVRMHTEDGLRKNAVGERARQVIADAGFDCTGLSDGNVRLVLDRPRVRV